MKIIKVQSPVAIKAFLDFPSELYKHDKYYIRPLDKEVEAVFDDSQNKLFKEGECERFIFKNEEDTIVGRVAVFINPKYEGEKPIGGLGFFDCIKDQNTANFIFDFCKNWLQERGMEAMDGSINFGERDKFWGVLTEGFTEPLYGMNYNAPYYADLFQNYGFQVYFNQLCYGRDVHTEVSKIFITMHEKHKQNPTISARPMKKNQLEKFAKDFTDIYNRAWVSHEGGKQLEYAKILKMFRTMKPVLNDHISWFVYEHQTPIAMWLNLPDLNQWFKHLNGKWGWFEKLKFLWLQQFKKNKKMVGLVFGVVPEWQGRGIDGYMIWEGTQHIRRYTHFETTELQWIGDFNPKMMKIAENLDTQVTRRLVTYRYLFDRAQKFQRHPMIK